MCSKILCFRINDDKDLSYCLLNFAKGYLFRGQSNARWGLTTTLDRKRSKNIEEIKLFLQDCEKTLREYSVMCAKNIEYKNEYSAIQTFRHLSFLTPQMKNIEILARMQHYGAATRLLDVTSSFLIALFFAFEDSNVQDCAVWLFNEKFFYDYSEIMEKYNTIYHYNYEEKLLDYQKFLNSKEIFYNKVLEQANEYIQKEDQNNQEKMSILPVKIVGNNPRLIAQNGAFLFPSTLRPFEDHLINILNMSKENFQNACNNISRKKIRNVKEDDIIKSAIIKLVFSHKMRPCVERLFNAANISYRSIYPDEIGIAKSIKYW